jgi:hypothetical protein
MNIERSIARNRYSLFGLAIDSELPLPELFTAQSTGAEDVSINIGRAPVEGEFEPGLHLVAGGALLVIAGTARYFVADGSRIVIEVQDGASERNVRLFLLGSAFGLLLHQRRMLPLHANAIEIDGEIVAFIGESGAGKSTLAAWFNDRGFPLIADDVAVVDFDGEYPIVQPGLPRLRLWESVIEATGRNPAEYALSVEGEPAYDKRDVLLPQARVASEPRRLGAIVELSRSGPLLEPLRGSAAAEAIMSHTYRGMYVKALETVRDHWLTCMRLVQAVPVSRACVDFDLNNLDRSYEPLLGEVRALLARSS